jgi:hypothetical protein
MKNRKVHIIITLFEILLFITNLYLGMYSFLKMLRIEYQCKMYYWLFWDNSNNIFKYPNYRHIALEYEMQPKYSIAISVAMIISFLFFVLIQKLFPKEADNKSSKKLYFIISALILLSLIITYSVIYCYKFEMAHEVV